MSFTVNSLESAKQCYMEILEAWREGKFLLVTIKKQTRLSIQNRWIQQCYTMISQQTGNPRPKIVNRCKFDFGMPILLMDNPGEARLWRKMMTPLEEWERHLSMEHMAVTRLFNVKECSDYIEQLIMEYGSSFELPAKNWKVKK